MSTTETVLDLDELCINTMRTLAIDAIQQAHSGHPGTPMRGRRALRVHLGKDVKAGLTTLQAAVSRALE